MLPGALWKRRDTSWLEQNSTGQEPGRDSCARLSSRLTNLEKIGNALGADQMSGLHIWGKVT